MHADLAPILVVGTLVALAAFAALALLVRRDLAPLGAFGGALDGGGRWFLGAALGLGVIAFSIKLVILSTLASFPAQTIAPLIEPRQPLAERDDPSLPDPAPPPTVPQWRGLPALVPHPADNPPNAAKLALGRRLFHETALSADRTLACASCHDVERGAGDDGRATAKGIGGAVGTRNTPTVFNAAYQARLFWDGRAASLEEQALGPMLNPIEMGLTSLEQIETRLRQDPSYAPAFAAAFGDDAVTAERAAQAIATYERGLVTADAPYDRFVGGDPHALEPAAQRGLWLFQSLGCAACHAGANFSGASLIGPRNPYAVLRAARLEPALAARLSVDKGRAEATAAEGLWRIPSLRNVALTAPYFHDGGTATLAEAIRVMVQAQVGATIAETLPGEREVLWWNQDSASVGRFAAKVVSRRDLADLEAFLRALSSDQLAARKRPG